MVATQEIPSKASTEVRNGAISLDELLDSAESITGTPTITASPSGLTFASVAANSTVAVIKGASVAIGRAVVFRVSGGTSGTKYTGTLTVGTDATPAQTITVTFRLLVQD
jgi:hypothetical protein